MTLYCVARWAAANLVCGACRILWDNMMRERYPCVWSCGTIDKVISWLEATSASHFVHTAALIWPTACPSPQCVAGFATKVCSGELVLLVPRDGVGQIHVLHYPIKLRMKWTRHQAEPDIRMTEGWADFARSYVLDENDTLIFGLHRQAIGAYFQVYRFKPPV